MCEQTETRIRNRKKNTKVYKSYKWILIYTDVPKTKMLQKRFSRGDRKRKRMRRMKKRRRRRRRRRTGGEEEEEDEKEEEKGGERGG